MSKKSQHFLTLWPWPLTYDLEKLIRSGHYHYQCVYQIWEHSIPWFLSYRVNTIAGGGRLWRKTITSPDHSDSGDIIIGHLFYTTLSFVQHFKAIGICKLELELQSGNAQFVSNLTIFLSRVTLKIDVWFDKQIRHLSYTMSSFVHHFKSNGEVTFELQPGNAQVG